MSARIFVHPRCKSGEALTKLDATLRAAGYDTAKFSVVGKELVRHVQTNLAATMYERFDGTRFWRKLGVNTPEPEAA